LQRSSGIAEALTETKAVTGKSLVLVVDQFEELFRYAAAGSARANPTTRTPGPATRHAIRPAARGEPGAAPQITVMLTMRPISSAIARGSRTA
jgi:hypothetical protein